MKNIFGGPTGRLVTVGIFFAVCAVIMGILFSGTGVRRPLIDSGEYTATVDFQDVDNLVKAAQIQTAGVRVGQVRSVTRLKEGGLRVEFALKDDMAPLHEGARLRLGSRSLVGESYLSLTDGTGAELPSGTQLPETAVEPSVQLNDVLASIDEETRGRLTSLLRTLGKGTSGSGQEISALLDGMGDLGREGHTALDAIAAQSADLEALARQTSAVLRALDTGQGQIADLVGSANRITAATAGQRQALEKTLRLAPGVLDDATKAADSLVSLSGALGPVATDLQAAAPNLTTALRELPGTTNDLRGMMAPMSRVLDQAPATLKRVPRTADDLGSFIPQTSATLSDMNPMLSYVKPYGPELAAYFANFNAVLNYRDENGAYYLRLTPLVNTHSLQLPVKTDGLLGNYTNAYPAPGTGATPGPFTGEYPRLERQRP